MYLYQSAICTRCKREYVPNTTGNLYPNAGKLYLSIGKLYLISCATYWFY
jgi:hypothetical protein